MSDAAISGRLDPAGHLVEADEPLAALQKAYGGEVPGPLAIPALVAIVRAARRVKIATRRELSLAEGSSVLNGRVDLEPDGSGWRVLFIRNRSEPPDPAPDEAKLLDAADRASAEAFGILGGEQEIVDFSTDAQDLAQIEGSIAQHPGISLNELMDLERALSGKAEDWRLLDGIRCDVRGSARPWLARVLPLDRTRKPSGFEWLLVPLSDPPPEAEVAARPPLIEPDVAPALRRSIAKIVANAETIKVRLEGSGTGQFGTYAKTIGDAGTHLSSLVADLVESETIEADGFSIEIEEVDLLEAVQKAVDLLAIRVGKRDIAIRLETQNENARVAGEFRRVLQILLNVIGNALAYSPEGSTIRVVTTRSDRTATVSIVDQGEGIPPAKADRLFTKFDRLDRGDAGGSGLGLYISRRLARAMDGDLVYDEHHTSGARFVLSLPLLQR